MDLSDFSRRLTDRLVEFAWEEWAQMGMSATPHRHSPWAQDPEALIVFTLEIARDEPRLFDELLDWLLANEPLLSVRRLRAMCTEDADRALTQAALAWLARRRPRARLRGQDRDSTRSRATPEPLFRIDGPIGATDEDFAAAGFLRSALAPSHKSQPPDSTTSINLAFLLRQVLGVGTRAEVIRVLLTSGAPQLTAQRLAQSTGYAKRNVHVALDSLSAAGVVSILTGAGGQRYTADRPAWAALLHQDPDELPVHRDWAQLFSALKRILRWSRQPELQMLSGYLRASRARDLLETIRPDLAFAGIAIEITRSPDGAYRDLQQVVEHMLAMLTPNELR